jgi:hypothetical protein
MDPVKTEKERREVKDGGNERHLSQGLSIIFGLPHMGQMGGIISRTLFVHPTHHLVPETPHPPHVGG